MATLDPGVGTWHEAQTEITMTVYTLIIVPDLTGLLSRLES